MPKQQFLSTRAYSAAYISFLFIIGSGLGALALLVNQQFHVSISVASLFSPTGAQLSVAGFRLKHWVTGLLIAIIGAGMFLKRSKMATINELGLVFIGIGFVLTADEYLDVKRFILTGQYP